MFRGTGHTSNIDVVKRRSLRSFRGRTFRELVAVFSGILARNASLGLYGSHDRGRKFALGTSQVYGGPESRESSTDVVRPIGDTAAPLVEVEFFFMTVRCRRSQVEGPTQKSSETIFFMQPKKPIACRCFWLSCFVVFNTSQASQLCGSVELSVGSWAQPTAV